MHLDRKKTLKIQKLKKIKHPRQKPCREFNLLYHNNRGGNTNKKIINNVFQMANSLDFVSNDNA